MPIWSRSTYAAAVSATDSHRAGPARTGTTRLFGKGDQVRAVPIAVPVRERVSAWLDVRADLLDRYADRYGLSPTSGPLWIGQCGLLSIDGLTDVVLAVGTTLASPGCDRTGCATPSPSGLREAGADVAQIQRLLGHARLATSARYFRASDEMIAEFVDQALAY